MRLKRRMRSRGSMVLTTLVCGAYVGTNTIVWRMGVIGQSQRLFPEASRGQIVSFILVDGRRIMSTIKTGLCRP